MSISRPLIIKLPEDESSYFEILSQAQAGALRSGFVILSPGKDVGLHDTKDFEEIIIILEGEGELEVETVRTKIAKGQVAYNPSGTRHNVINTGNAPLKYIYVVAKVKKS